MALTSSALGQLLVRLLEDSKESTVGLSIILVTTAWLLLPLFGIIAFYGTALYAPTATYPAVTVFNDLTNCFFEAMSGFTGTGLTMVSDPSKLPHTLQWWRSLMEWVGGIGVIMLASILMGFNHDEENFYKTEIGTWTIEDVPISTTIRKIWYIYLAYTAASIVAFFAGGMPLWEALNHGVTAIGTGGFAVTSNSFIDYSPLIKAIAAVIMIVGAISFKIHFLLFFRKDLGRVFKQTQLRYFAAIFVSFLLLLIWTRPESKFIDIVFQLSSALGTCGLNSEMLGLWSMSPLFLLVVMMVLGGNAGSTAGGIKTERFAWLLKGLLRGIKQVWLSEDNKPCISYNSEIKKPRVTDRNIDQAAIIFFLWMMMLVVGTLLLAQMTGDHFTFHQILFEVASALSNVGLSSGITGPGLPDEVKLLLSFLMWMGRLEIIAALILLLSPIHFMNKRASY